jgi:hypothetical protein
MSHRRRGQHRGAFSFSGLSFLAFSFSLVGAGLAPPGLKLQAQSHLRSNTLAETTPAEQSPPNNPAQVHRNPSYTAFASANLSITNFFSASEFQSGYFDVSSITRSTHAAKYFASSGDFGFRPAIVT